MIDKKKYAAILTSAVLTGGIVTGCGNTSVNDNNAITGVADVETTANEDSEAQDTSSPEAVVSYYEGHTFTAEINEEVSVSDFVEAAVSASGGEIRVTDNGITLPTMWSTAISSCSRMESLPRLTPNWVLSRRILSLTSRILLVLISQEQGRAYR